jgi:hypothetical protein
MKRIEICTKSARIALAAVGFAVTMSMAAPAHAQLSGENLLGDMGTKSGTQPEPGLYVASIYYRYRTDTLKDANGQSVNADPSGEQIHSINAAVPLIYWVTPKKVFGAHFAMMAVVPLANGGLEAPGLGLSETASMGMSDAYVMPAQLGWHTKRFDAVTGFAFFAPTGRYTAGASDNLGKNMWSYEASAGGTLYLDGERSLSLATTAYWETHSRKQGNLTLGSVPLDHVKVGDLVTLEGGVAKTFLHGALSLGAAYYAQWKTTADEVALQTLPEMSGIPLRHRVFGLGPDVTIPIATKTKLLSFVNVRYFWEQGAQLKTQGQTFLVQNTIPIGGIKIPGSK